MNLKALFLSTAISTVATVAHAQEETRAGLQESAIEEVTDGVDDIVVTATRREERLQEVPIAVTAMSGADLQAAGIDNARELNLLVPNLTFTMTGPENAPIIRGVVNTAAGIGDDANVPTYVDGVLIPAMSQTSQELLEVERIEVLRGPQGTLFGRNSTGGLINIITKRPSYEPSGHITLRAGTYGGYGINGYATLGISDKIAAAFSGLVGGDDGYIRDLVRGGRSNPRRSYGARSKLLFEPSDRAELILAASYTKFNDASAPSYAPVDRNAQARNPLLGGNPDIILADGTWNASTNIDTVYRGDAKDINLSTKFELENFDVLTTTSAAKYGYLYIGDLDGTTAALSRSFNRRRQTAYTQEVRIVSTGDRALDWIIGAFAYSGEASSIVRIGPNPTTSTFAVNPVVHIRSLAPFAEVTYHFTDALSVRGGLRYTSERREFEQTLFGNKLFDVSATYNRLTPRVVAQYLVNSNANLYASYSRGFKSGTFNTFGVSTAAVLPEDLDSYEVGAKLDPASWVRLNLSLFHYDYKNLQVSTRDPVTQIVTLGNAAAARIRGAEAELTLQPTPDLTLRASAAMQDGEYTSFGQTNVFLPRLDAASNPIGGNIVVQQDATGNRPPRAPKYSGNFSAQYSRPVGSGSVGGSASMHYVSKIFWDFGNTDQTDAYARINGELFWSPNEALKLSLWASNVTNAKVVLNRSQAVLGTFSAYESPRRIGATVRLAF